MHLVLFILNVMYLKFKIKFKVIKLQKLEAAVQELETEAYQGAGIGNCAEGVEYAHSYLRGARDVSGETHLGIFYRNKLIAYFAFFTPVTFLFDQSREFDDGVSRVVVFTKLMRNPGMSKLLMKSQALRLALVTSITILSLRGSFYLETQAQPDTLRLLQEKGALDRVFKNVQRLIFPVDLTSSSQILLKFPQMKLVELLRIVRAMRQEFKRSRKASK